MSQWLIKVSYVRDSSSRVALVVAAAAAAVANEVDLVMSFR